MKRSPALPLALLLAVLLPAAACQKNATTPRGAEILRWEGSARERGPRVSRDLTLRARPARKGNATFAVHVETAPVEVVKDGTTSLRPAPVALRLTVERNDDWTLQASCADAPADAQVPCAVGMEYRDTFNDVTYRLTLQVAGDGSVHAALPDGAVTPD